MTLHIGLNARRTNADGWGDLAFAHCLRAAFTQLGHHSTVFFRDETPDLTGRDDVVLRIIGPHLDEPVPGVPNLLWVISPPNQAPFATLARYQGLFHASMPLVERCLAHGLHASYLPQATDGSVFSPAARGDDPIDLDISFVGNFAPRAPRANVLEAVRLGFDVKIWGQGWEGVVPPRHICDTRLDIAELAQVYARSRVVLNSHMPYMAEVGFMSNRSFDAMACGAQVVSDPVQGFSDPALGALHQIGTDHAMAETLARLVCAGQDIAARAASSATTLEHYSFAARAKVLATEAARLLELDQRAQPAFSLMPARAAQGDIVAITLSDYPKPGEALSVALGDWLDALMAKSQLDVTLALSDPSTTPNGLSVEEAMLRAAAAVGRIGAVIARKASFARLTVIAPATLACKGLVHAMMPDHRAAQAAACDHGSADALAALDRVCTRARRVLEGPVGEVMALAELDQRIDPVQAQIRQLANRPLYAHSPVGFSRDRQKRHLLLWPRNALGRLDVPVGVFVHLYHADLAALFRDRLAVLDLPHRLYVSTDTQEKANSIQAQIPLAVVRVVPNRGRDVFGKVYGFADAHADHEIVLHLHGKKSLHASGLDRWLDLCLQCLLPSRDEVLRIVSLFQSVPDLGIVAPLTFKSVLAAAHWGDNFDIARELVARMPHGIALPDDAGLDFPVGSMFWARRKAMQPLLDLCLTAAHFPPETGQLDATPAHAIERLFGVICQAGGYHMIRVAPAGSHQHKARQIVAKRNEDVRRFLQDGVFGQ
ncbi:rhamnan synthesis F family protein [Pseudotabrizicola sp.]|nr:rhamnan synthesis F family protein [Pseudotabrizicola sp.]